MSDPVSRLNTALEGRYAIERELGEGGMATVYLAKDLKHNRNVALKVLKRFLSVQGVILNFFKFKRHRTALRELRAATCPLLQGVLEASFDDISTSTEGFPS